MLVINKSKRNIDGIKPLETKDISDDKAKKLLKMYSNEIHFIDGKNLNLDSNLKAENERLKAENENLKAEIAGLKAESNEDNFENETIDELRSEYFEVYGEEVPRNMKNKTEWIQEKIEEKKAE